MTTQARASTRSAYLTRQPVAADESVRPELYTTIALFGVFCYAAKININTLSAAEYTCIWHIASDAADKLNALFGYNLT